MTGLRERKKRQVRQRIVEAAEKLFASRGLDATTMDEIAAAAEVSVATVYNYFGSKTTLLLAALDDDTATMIAGGARILAEPGDDPLEAVQRMIDAYLAHMSGWDRAFMRELMAASFQPGEDELLAEVVRMDEQLMAQVAQLLAGFDDRGLLGEGVAAEEAALLIYSTLMTALVMHAGYEARPAAELARQVHRQIDLAFDGIGRADTNERETNE